MIFPTSGKIDVQHFLELARFTPIIDVRSPSEYNAGHIPGAFNIPLFDDSERQAVGIKYKDHGREKAILTGLELIGNKLNVKLAEAMRLSGNSKILVHCWRGGIRSEAMAWLFSLGHLQMEVIGRRL